MHIAWRLCLLIDKSESFIFVTVFLQFRLIRFQLNVCDECHKSTASETPMVKDRDKNEISFLIKISSGSYVA